MGGSGPVVKNGRERVRRRKWAGANPMTKMGGSESVVKNGSERVRRRTWVGGSQWSKRVEAGPWSKMLRIVRRNLYMKRL